MDNNDIRQRIGSELRALREAQGLTVRVLADKAGVIYSHITRIEQGKYNLQIDTLHKVTTALGATIKIEPPTK